MRSPTPSRAVSISTGAQRLLPQRSADRDPVRAGEHDVEADGVVVVDPGLEEGLLAGPGDVDRIPLAAQTARQRARELRVVLDDQETHAWAFANAAPPGHQSTAAPPRTLRADV